MSATHTSADLFRACKRGDLALAQAAIAAGADVNMADHEGYFPLHLAAKFSRFEIVQTLIEAGAGVNTIDSGGWIALHFALCKEHFEQRIIDLLILKQSSINAVDQWMYSPLHVAMDSGHPEVVGKLIDAGADLNARTSDGLTPLGVAVEFGQVEMVKALIENGADPCLAPDPFFVEQIIGDSKNWVLSQAKRDLVMSTPGMEEALMRGVLVRRIGKDTFRGAWLIGTVLGSFDPSARRSNSQVAGAPPTQLSNSIAGAGASGGPSLC